MFDVVQCILVDDLNALPNFIFTSSMVLKSSGNANFSDIPQISTHTRSNPANTEARESRLLSLSNGFESSGLSTAVQQERN